jgi:hypothetical protein
MIPDIPYYIIMCLTCSIAFSHWNCKPCLYVQYPLLRLLSQNQRLGGIPSTTQWPEFQANLKKLYNFKKETLFTAAHQVMGFEKYCESMTCLLRYSQRWESSVLDLVTDNIIKQRNEPQGSEKIIHELLRLPYVGPFYAWQSESVVYLFVVRRRGYVDPTYA